MRSVSPSIARLALCASLILILPAMSGLARAQEPATGGEFIGGVLDALKLRTKETRPADFVEKSRPDRDSLDYDSLSADDKKRAAKKKAPAELGKLEAEMESALQKNRRAAARVAIPDVPAPSSKRGE